MIRLIIAGPRDYYDQEKVFRDIHTFQGKFGIDEIISGGASGVDKLAEEYAFLHQIPFKLFQADWEKYGKAAGPACRRSHQQNIRAGGHRLLDQPELPAPQRPPAQQA